MCAVSLSVLMGVMVLCLYWAMSVAACAAHITDYGTQTRDYCVFGYIHCAMQSNANMRSQGLARIQAKVSPQYLVRKPTIGLNTRISDQCLDPILAEEANIWTQYMERRSLFGPNIWKQGQYLDPIFAGRANT
jgi:hypothetical protein